MQIKIVSIATLAILGWLNIPVALSKPSAFDNGPPALQSNVRAEFNLLLAGIRADSTIDQFARLRDFLEDHADFEPVYHTLLERYLYNDRIQEAKTYFQQLTASSPHSRNSYWVLARIFIRENNAHEAFRTLAQALKIGKPSLFLLEEFVKFDHQHSGIFDGTFIIRQLGLQPEIQEIVSAFYSYYKLDYLRTIEVFKKVSSHISHKEVVLHLWGNCAYALTRYSEADSLWRIGLKLSRQDGDLRAQARFLLNIGFLQQILLKQDLALSYYDSAYAVAKHISYYFQMYLLAGYRACINRDRGNYLEAEKQFQEAIQIASRIGDQNLLAEWYAGYAMTIYYLGKYNDALQALDKSEALAQKSNDLGGIARIKLNKAIVYIFLKQNQLAKKILHDVIELAQANNLKYYQEFAKAQLGEIFFLEKQYNTARVFYQQFIDYLNTNESLRKQAFACIGKFAQSYILERRYETAKKAYQQALAEAKKADAKTFQGWYLIGIANSDLNLGNSSAAIKNYDLAREIATAQANTDMLWEIFLGYGNAYKKTGELHKAISWYGRAANIIEKTRKELNVDQLRIGYFIERNQVYQNLIDCFLQKYQKSGNRADLDSLYYYLSMEQARALKDLKLKPRAFVYSDEYQQTCQQLHVLQRRLREESDKFTPAGKLDDLLSQIETARFSLLAQRLQVGVNTPDSTQSRQEVVPSLSTVLDRLKEAKLGLLLYHITEETSFVLVAAGEEVKVVRLPVSLSALAAQIDTLMAPFHNVDADSVQATPFKAAIAHRLYQLLIKPIEEALLLPPRLLIVPDLALMNLPFEMLLIEPPESSDYTPSDFPSYADHFLLHRYTLVYTPSTTLLQEEPKAKAKLRNYLVFANPFGGAPALGQNSNSPGLRTGWRFDPLPFSEVEADRIKSSEPQTRVYTRANATKATFIKEAPQYQIVHIATHAFVDTTFDAFSGLVLATSDDSTDDGMLMGYEIADLDLRCDLVTLSACETGRGKLVAGEGVLGLPRLFLGAGAQSVLMTLWKVDDKFASDLMPRFYHKLLNEKLSKADALAAAKRLILGQRNSEDNIYYQHPFYWASFVLYGDPGMRQVSSPTRMVLAILFTAILILGLIGVFSIRHRRLRH